MTRAADPLGAVVVTLAALRHVAWRSLPREDRGTEGGIRYARKPGSAQFDELDGLTEAELLALMPGDERDRWTAAFNGETAPGPATKTPAVARPGPGPKKARPKESKRRATGTK